MTDGFSALRSYSPGDTRLEKLSAKDLGGGEVLVEVHYSSVNYKDALAITGRGKILKRHPLIPGIDAAGIVIESSDRRFVPGQKILVTGGGIGENDDGGYTERLRLRADTVVPCPEGLSLREAMILGTAGFTAALALDRMRINGQTPEMGPILITGASGGVGGFAVELFARAGFTVHALSGKPSAAGALRSRGAAEVLMPEQLALGSRPLESVKFGGAVDNVGGELLGRILAHIQLWGNVAAIGLAAGHDLQTTVMPFILRGVSLLGVSSNNTPMDQRLKLWRLLSTSWKPAKLEDYVARTVFLPEVARACEELLARKIQGRLLVDIRGGG
jgi:acrylyl-CoA reductase (NADPH)